MPIDYRYFKFREDALGSKPVDRLLTNCRLVNVLSGRIEVGVSIAVSGTRVVGIGDYQANESIDVGGRYVYPGLMDAHMHIESTKLTIPQLARAFSHHGTTSIFADPNPCRSVVTCSVTPAISTVAVTSGKGRVAWRLRFVETTS